MLSLFIISGFVLLSAGGSQAVEEDVIVEQFDNYVKRTERQLEGLHDMLSTKLGPAHIHEIKTTEFKPLPAIKTTEFKPLPVIKTTEFKPMPVIKKSTVVPSTNSWSHNDNWNTWSKSSGIGAPLLPKVPQLGILDTLLKPKNVLPNNFFSWGI